jgi:phenylpropionate dioxygenase-like ring-hydroxylating dioxygenase large terminal subunit
MAPRHYVDPALFERERDRVFGGQWVPVCRVEDVRNAGDFVTYDLAGDPVVVTRTRDGALRALANVCRHRNMILVEGAGNVPALQCPYHRWTYDLDGALVAAPQFGDVDGFDRSAHCLPHLAVDTWQGFVLVNTDVDAAPLGPRLAGLDAVVDRYGMADMVRDG